MDSQEQFFKEQLKVIQEARNEKEDRFDNLRRAEQSFPSMDPQKRYVTIHLFILLLLL